METGNEAAIMRSLWSPFAQRLTCFLKNALCFTVDPEAAAVDALCAKIADWNSMLMAFSFGSAVQIPAASSQIQSKLPPSFQLLSLSILLGFSSLLVAKLAELKAVKPSKLFHCLGFLSLVYPDCQQTFYIKIKLRGEICSIGQKKDHHHMLPLIGQAVWMTAVPPFSYIHFTSFWKAIFLRFIHGCAVAMEKKKEIMETGNRAAIFTSSFSKVWSFIRDSAAVAVDALSVKIADSASMLLSFSFASAVQMAVLSLQIQSKLPPSFPLLSLSILLGFAFLLVAKLAEFKTLKPAKLLHCLGFLFLVIAFFIAISIPFPLYFTIISFVFFLAILVLVIYFTIIP